MPEISIQSSDWIKDMDDGHKDGCTFVIVHKATV